MSWTVSYHSDRQFVETQFEGVLSAEELAEAIGATMSALEEHHTLLVLADCSLLRGGHTFTDLYLQADEVARSGKALGVREALIQPEFEAPAESASFWKTIANNRGMTVQVFDDRAIALDWLLSAA